MRVFVCYLNTAHKNYLHSVQTANFDEELLPFPKLNPVLHPLMCAHALNNHLNVVY